MVDASPDKMNDALASKCGPCSASSQQVGAYNPQLSEQAWTAEPEKKALKETPKGRAIIRMFSRGVLGTATFAIAGLYAGKRMATYAPEKPVENWVQGIARFYDHAAGKPIKAAVDAIGKDGEHFVNSFRPNIYYPAYGGKKGRSLGHEVVIVTFDFGAMSIGDFWGRKIMHTLDRHEARPKWKREDGSIDWGKAVETFGKNWWTAITYSAGEDWAVAVPYVLTMRHIGTPLLNKAFPGFQYDFDLNGNGGGLLINDKGRITGNFTTAGVLNLWERFTTYNVGTLLFREAYRFTGNRITHWWKTGDVPVFVHSDDGKPFHSGLDAATTGVKQFGTWLARGTMKALIYMIPAVPFFWITRTPQHKFKGPLIHPEKGPLMYLKDGKELTAVRATTLYDPAHPRTRFTDMNFTPHTEVFFGDPKNPEIAVNPFIHGPIEPNVRTWDAVDTALNPFARFADKTRETLRKPVGHAFTAIGTAHEWVREKIGFPVKDPAFLGNREKALSEGRKRAGTYILASMAYTPYFWAKSDWLADRLDYGRMDVAAERTIKGAIHLNPNEVEAGAKEIWQAIKREPLKDPVREEYAQCREATDETPSDNKYDVNPYIGQSCDVVLQQEPKKPQPKPKKRPPQPKPELSWRERLVSGKPEEKLELEANKRKSHAEKEELRQLLEQSTPPTNSIN